MIYKRTGNLRACQLLLGHSKLESTVRYPASKLMMPCSCLSRQICNQACAAGSHRVGNCRHSTDNCVLETRQGKLSMLMSVLRPLDAKRFHRLALIEGTAPAA